jgi:hypothetical protein
MRLYRKRQRRGERCVRIPIGPAEIDRLIEKGYLGPGEREDVEALEFAASSFNVSDTEKSGKVCYVEGGMRSTLRIIL